VNNRLPKREQAIGLLRQNHCAPNVISHCEAVAKLALEIVGKLEKKGLKIDRELVEAGALLHDLGRSKSQGVDHVVVGAEIAESSNLPDSVVRIIRRHVGGGITAEEAKAFGWPNDVYVPDTLEEKIVSYSDKLIDNSNRVSINVEIERLLMKHKAEAAERVRKLHEEITGLLEN
jgi:uncharacterized protein